MKPEFLKEIPYSSFRKRLDRKKMKLRFNELRDYFGTYLLNHGILEAEIDLCQGRIPVDIFIRHYWSPKLKELGYRVFKALMNSKFSLFSLHKQDRGPGHEIGHRGYTFVFRASTAPPIAKTAKLNINRYGTQVWICNLNELSSIGQESRAYRKTPVTKIAIEIAIKLLVALNEIGAPPPFSKS